MLAIISEMLKFQPVQRGTDLNKAIQYVSNAQKKRCTTFLISDFCDTKNYQQALTIACTKHDMVAIQVYDPREQELPDVGLMHVCDAETGEDRWVDTSSSRVREAYAQWWQQMQAKKQEAFLHSQVDSVSVSTDEDFVPALLALFKKRS